jgi:hypothetical protein
MTKSAANAKTSPGRHHGPTENRGAAGTPCTDRLSLDRPNWAIEGIVVFGKLDDLRVRVDLPAFTSEGLEFGFHDERRTRYDQRVLVSHSRRT